MATILVIDDEQPFRTMLSQTLKREGYEVFTAADGKEGLQIFSREKIDLVITDIVMPEKEGMETILELRIKNNPPPVIAISGGGTVSADSYLKLARDLGAQRTLEKPFERQELLAAIRELLQDA